MILGYEHRKRPSGLKYNIRVVNRGWKKKGERPESYEALRAWWKDEQNLPNVTPNWKPKIELMDYINAHS